jgi:hypothetical protein
VTATEVRDCCRRLAAAAAAAAAAVLHAAPVLTLSSDGGCTDLQVALQRLGVFFFWRFPDDPHPSSFNHRMLVQRYIS